MDQYFEALEKSKNSIVLNIVEQMGFDETADVLEKGHAAQMGEIRIWNNIKYQKTPNGWVPVKGEQKSEKKEGKYSVKQYTNEMGDKRFGVFLDEKIVADYGSKEEAQKGADERIS